MQMPDPVIRRLDDVPDVEIRRHDGGKMGRALHAANAVSIRNDLSWHSFCCTLLHELLHLLNGPQCHGLRAKEEESVRRQTAREMLPDIYDIGEALAWAHTPMEAADELGVDIYVLRKRLRHMHPAERGYLQRRLSEVP
ncbi:MAG: hypothetical protein F2667_00005 [Actinobacteria bacterium]|uniref:Unannotated protein n=1 Tax=freshwater metagenome TaxID=449393 RepID=A0A6J6NGG4_9ZZZZ|nr:hypothetical protein [Actinomycetota bacterium]